DDVVVPVEVQRRTRPLAECADNVHARISLAVLGHAFGREYFDRVVEVDELAPDQVRALAIVVTGRIDRRHADQFAREVDHLVGETLHLAQDAVFGAAHAAHTVAAAQSCVTPTGAGMPCFASSRTGYRASRRRRRDTCFTPSPRGYVLHAVAAGIPCSGVAARIARMMASETTSMATRPSASSSGSGASGA